MHPYTTQTESITTLVQYHAPRLTLCVWRDPFRHLHVEIDGYDPFTGPIAHNPLVSVCAVCTDLNTDSGVYETTIILNALRMVAGYHKDVAKLTELVTEHYADKGTS